VSDTVDSRRDASTESLPPGYRLRESPPTVERFRTLREVAGMAPRPREGVERWLQNSLYAVTAVHEDDGVVGMCRVVGDGGSVYHVTDTVVHPDHQGLGLGTVLTARVLAFVEADAPPGAYVNLIADVEGFYERFGFRPVQPASRGMYLRVGQRDDRPAADGSGDVAGDPS
jgi:GNAT superfamily N-acetyltransferase